MFGTYKKKVKFMEKRKKILFIFNPCSGKEQIKNKLADILDVFAKADMEIVVRPTQHAKDAYETIAKTGHEYNMVVSAGGDGTLNESFNGLMEVAKEQRPYFGYIPTGTTNDFANTLMISKNPLEAAQGILEGEKFWCDVGKANTGYFAYVAAFGVFTNVAYDTPQGTKNMLGHLAYILEGIKGIVNIESYDMKVEYQNKSGNKKDYEDSFIFGMVSNTRSVGGMNLKNSDTIDLQDGYFEVILVKKPNNPIELQLTINALLTRDFQSDRLYFFHTDAVRFNCEKDVSWTLDGEYGGTQKKMSVINLPKEILMKVKPVKKGLKNALLSVIEGTNKQE